MLSRLLRVFYRAPDYLIGREGDWYLRRWYVIPRNRLFNIYLHNMLRDDDDRALHDHPWWNISIVLHGGYWEIMPEVDAGRGMASWAYQFHRRVWRGVGYVVLRRAEAAHRLALQDKKPSWSLFITGPNIRTWGFWCPKGWRPWREFVADTPEGNTIGAGCGEP